MTGIKTIAISILTVGLLAGSAVGVAAQNALVTGGGWGGDDCQTTEDGAMFCAGRWESDDERLTGDYELTITDAFAEDGGTDLLFAHAVGGEGRLTNDGGSWRFLYDHTVFEPVEGWVPEGWPAEADLPSQYQGWIETGEQFFFIGEGGYEGMRAYITSGPRGAWGVIVEPGVSILAE